MSSTPLHTRVDILGALRRAWQAREVSARDLASSALDAAQAHVDLNAFLHIDRDLTLAQADAADQQLAQGQAGPLKGIPIAHQDVFATQGWRTTAASKMLEHYTSPFDATVAALQQQAGPGAIA